MNGYYRLEFKYDSGSRINTDYVDFSAVDDDDAREIALSKSNLYSGSKTARLYSIGHEIPLELNQGGDTVAQLIAQGNGSIQRDNESYVNYMARTSYLVKSDYDFVGNGAVNITSVSNVDLLQEIGDYQSMWYIMYGLVVSAGGVQNLPTEDQAIALGWMTMDKKKVKKLIKSRRDRVDEISAILWNQLDRVQVEELMDEISSADLVTKYIEENRQGTSEGDSDGILDYINSTSSFSGSGLSSKAWVPASITLSQLIADVSSILKFGGV